MIDLSGQVVNIVLNPAGTGTEYNLDTQTMTFTDAAGNVQNVSVGKLVERPDRTWATCFPRVCME